MFDGACGSWRSGTRGRPRWPLLLARDRAGGRATGERTSGGGAFGAESARQEGECTPAPSRHSIRMLPRAVSKPQAPRRRHHQRGGACRPAPAARRLRAPIGQVNHRRDASRRTTARRSGRSQQDERRIERGRGSGRRAAAPMASSAPARAKPAGEREQHDLGNDTERPQHADGEAAKPLAPSRASRSRIEAGWPDEAPGGRLPGTPAGKWLRPAALARLAAREGTSRKRVSATAQLPAKMARPGFRATSRAAGRR
jgi:hypothetical protein